MEVLVEYDYSAQNIDELTISKGDRIKNVVRKEEGWFEGELIGSNGKRGLFPDNFVKPIKIPPANLNGKTLPFTANLIKSPEDNRKKKILNGKLISQQPIVVPTSSPPPPPPPSIIQQPPLPVPKPPKQISPPVNAHHFKARVLYSYIPVNEDELAIQENEIVQVIRLVEDGWYEGIHAGKQGVFPSNYVEKIAEQIIAVPAIAPAIQPTQPLNNSLSNESINNSSLIEDSNDEKKKSKKVMGIGFGNIFSGKTIELKTKEMNNKNIYTEHNKQIETNNEKPTITVKKSKARVLYEYAPTQPDELKLATGEIIYILDKNLEDEGWWRGESISTGAIGVFPDNFVEEIDEPIEVVSPVPTTQQIVNSAVLKKKLNISQQANLNDNNQIETNSLTNSVSSNSSSNNSLSKSSITNGVTSNNGHLNTNKNNLIITSSFEEHNSKSQSDLSEDLEDFNQDANKLTHIKKTKQQNKRPPSFRAKKVIESDKTEEVIKPEVKQPIVVNNIKEELPLSPTINSPQMIRNFQEASVTSRQQTPTSPKSSPLSFNQLNSHHNSNYLNSAGNSSSSSGVNLTNGHNSTNCISQQSLVDEIGLLKEELDSIKKNSTQMQNDYKTVQSELTDLKKIHEEQMKKMSRKLVDLIGEIDDEKKTRLALQVELERLKKTIMNY